MGFTEILTIIFITLKVLDVIDWSWWLVLLPEIIAFIFYVITFIIYIKQVNGIKKAFKDVRDEFEKRRF